MAKTYDFLFKLLLIGDSGVGKTWVIACGNMDPAKVLRKFGWKEGLKIVTSVLLCNFLCSIF